MKFSKGFTLIEMVFVIVIVSIISVMASRPLLQSLQSYHQNKNIINADWEYRYALERMSREIHDVQSSSAITAATATQFAFTNLNGQLITFNLTGGQLTRTNASGLNTAQNLASGITSTTLFEYYNSAGTQLAQPISAGNLSTIRFIKINLSVVLNNFNLSLTTAVYPRFSA